VLSQSGAFTNVDAQEVLTQAQFTGSLKLAEDSKKVYRALVLHLVITKRRPGETLLDDDS
jgi:hypothetical protein